MLTHIFLDGITGKCVLADPLEDTARDTLNEILRHQFVTFRKKKTSFMSFDSETFTNVKMTKKFMVRMRTK